MPRLDPTLLDRILERAFTGAVPPLLDELIDREAACGVMVDRFVLAPILPFDADRPVRFYVSDELDKERWEAAVRRAWPDPDTAAFLELARPDMRRMVDADASGRGTLYLDDLQVREHGLPEAAAGRLMCECLSLPIGPRNRMTVHREPAHDLVPEPLLPVYKRLLYKVTRPFFALRWRDGQVVSLLWITEGRWWGRVRTLNRLADELGAPELYRELRALIEDAGLVAYPDAVEIPVEGAPELHLGICSPDRRIMPPPNSPTAIPWE